jgi:PAS domain S-box-containing protein
MQSALQETEERLTIFVSSVIDYAIIMLDAKGVIVSWNSGAQRIYGYDAAEVTGLPFVTFLSKDDSEIGKLQVELDKAKDDGQCTDLGWRVRKDGSRFRAEICFTALKDDKGQLRGFGTVTHDLTQPVKDETKPVGP